MTTVIGTAGHVDHGKSTLVTALTGIDPDRLAEEKAREMTIDLGFAWLTLPNGESVGVVDVPGHRDFIENMLAGVGGIDLALFVIAADEGIMPQTREHLAIIDLLDIPGGVIALTKIDLITDPDWLELVSADVSQALRDTTLANAPIVPVSARTGEGLDRLIAALQEALSRRPPRRDRGRPRLPVDRVFTMSGFGTVVTGTLSDGSISVGDEVDIQPSGRRARIRGMQTHKAAVDVAQPGSRVAINLTGVNKDEVGRGDVIAHPGTVSGTTLLDVHFRHLAGMSRPLRHNTQVKFFSGAAETVAHARLLGDQELSPGAEGWLQLRLEAPVALDRGDHFILRYPSPAETLGGGVVLDPHPAHRWRRFKPDVLARLETLLQGSPEGLLLTFLEGQSAVAVADLPLLVGAAPSDMQANLAKLHEQGDILSLADGWVIARSAWVRLSVSLSRELAEFHRANPLKPGMPREALRSRLAQDQKAYVRILDFAVQTGLAAGDGATLRQPDHAIRFSAAQQKAVDGLLAAIRANPISTPSVKDAAASVGADALQALFDLKTLIQVSPDVLFDAETYADLVRQVEEFIAKNGSITVGQARDLFNTTRKYVLALLEHLDATGVTKRVGDQRVLRQG